MAASRSCTAALMACVAWRCGGRRHARRDGPALVLATLLTGTLLALFGQSYRREPTSTSSSSPGPADDRVRACGSVRGRCRPSGGSCSTSPRDCLRPTGHKPRWVQARRLGHRRHGPRSHRGLVNSQRRRPSATWPILAFRRRAAVGRAHAGDLRFLFGTLLHPGHRRWAGLFATGRGAVARARRPGGFRHCVRRSSASRPCGGHIDVYRWR